MEKKTELILQKIRSKSQRSEKNLELIGKYVDDNLRLGRLITFYNWECPPRFVDSKDGKTFINYDLNLQDVFDGKKLDEFIELPRVVESSDREVKILNFLSSLGLKFRFVKIIADTNAYYLTPNSLDITGEEKIRNKSEEFKNLIIKEAKKYPLPVEVYLFTELIQPFKNNYDKYFDQALDILKNDSESLLNGRIINEQIIRTKKHIGLGGEKEVRDFVRRTLASYGAEGMIFDLLAQTDAFSNCIWLNIEEADERTMVITNCLRNIYNKGELPVIFPK